jgi:dihydroorotate dehydrogenase electron transfer subunit
MSEQPSIIQKKYTVTGHEEVADGYFKLTFDGPEIATHYHPTQFVNIKVSEDITPLLRKPLSIYDANGSEFSVLYKIYGEGTAKLARTPIGAEVDVLGPLGKVHHIDTTKKTALVAGGVGIASVMSLAHQIPGNFDLYYGVRSRSELAELDRWEGLATNIHIASDDGSVGQKGFVTELFAQKADQYDQLYCCGPHPMMAALYKVCPDQITPYFLMEEYMACGFGICVGCVVNTTDRGYIRICKEGPVIDGRNVEWES